MSEQTARAREMIDLVRRLGVALINAETFSADHPITKKQIATAYEYIAGLLQRHNKPVIVTAAAGRILFDRAPLADSHPVVAKLAARLEDDHANHITFDHGLTVADMEGFFHVLGKGSKFISAHGGLPKLLAAAKVTHVTVRALDFVMVDGDQKVVSKAALVVESSAGKEGTADTTTIQEILQKLVVRTDEHEWLLQEMKNNPQRVVDLFMAGINLVASRMETGMTGESAGAETLLTNIELLGSALVSEQPGAPPEDREALEKFIVILEKEVRQCSARLISSKVAAGLTTEILGLVTSYADEARASKIADELLRGDKSLKKLRRLLRNLTPAIESVEGFISRIRKHLLRHGLAESDLARLEEAVKAESKPRPPAKPRKCSSEAIARAIEERLRDINLEPALLKEIVVRLSRFIEDRAREKAGELRPNVEKLRGQLSHCENVLQNLPGSVVLWNAEGKVEFISHAVAQILGSETGVDLSATLKARLREWSFPLTTPASPSADLSDAEMQLLRSVSLVFRSETGDVYGVLLSVGSSGSKRP